MKRNLTRSLVIALVVGAFGLGAAASAQAPAKASLYKRLGGYDAIAAVTDDFIGRLIADARFAKFFAGASTDSKGKIRQHVVDQLCNAAGGPKYTCT